jgi:hypothetical protein
MAEAPGRFYRYATRPFDFGVVSVSRAYRYTCARLRTVAVGVTSHH